MQLFHYGVLSSQGAVVSEKVGKSKKVTAPRLLLIHASPLLNPAEGKVFLRIVKALELRILQLVG